MSSALQISPHPQSIPHAHSYRRVNGFAVSAFVVVFFASVVGLVLGYVALSQMKQTGERGHGLALAAVVLGWVFTVGTLVAGGLLVVGGFALRLY